MAIKVFRSDQLGAPVINGMAGTLITALDAILVNGYGQVSVTSITRSGSTATVETGAAHGFKSGDIALIAGAGEVEYNGEHLVSVLTATSFTFAVAGEPDSPATGTITSKRAPAGFSKVFAATNKGVYRSNDISSRRHFLRVDDTGGTLGGSREAVIKAYEAMTDVDTGVGMYPSVAQNIKGFFWQKSDVQDALGRHWIMITDGKTLYHFAYFQSRLDPLYTYNAIENPGNNMSSVGFGDVIGFKPGDAYASFLTGAPGENQLFSQQSSGLFTCSTTINNAAPSELTAMIVFARDFTSVEGPRVGQVYASGLGSIAGSTPYIAYPHAIDNGFYMVPMLAVQGSPSLIRGRMPGLFEPMHGMCFPNAALVDNVQGYVGRKFMMLYGKNYSSLGSCMIDITGPWDS